MNFKGGNFLPTYTVSNYKVFYTTDFPLSLPLHINLSPKKQDWLIVAPSAACYLYYSQYPLPQNKRLVKINYSSRNLTYWTGFVHRLLLGDNIEEYADSVFHWPVKIVTTDTECSSQKLMTTNQTWCCHKPSQCRDLLSIQISIKSPKFILKQLYNFIHYNLAPINLITLTCMIICSLAHLIYTLLCFHFCTHLPLPKVQRRLCSAALPSCTTLLSYVSVSCIHLATVFCSSNYFAVPTWMIGDLAFLFVRLGNVPSRSYTAISITAVIQN